jgi:NAD-dependent dihydropyrimidine dehydrogenase PreA subunit
VVGGLEVGISGIGDIIERALERLDEPDETVKELLLAELKARNYVPGGSEGEYIRSLWNEYKKLRVQRREQTEMSHKGIPRDEIPWFPTIDPSKCTGCSSCADFCTQGVFKFDGKISHVVKPYACTVGKSSCRSFCPEKAISFPKTAELKDTMRGLKDKYGVRD